jgi:hypothetical protein
MGIRSALAVAAVVAVAGCGEDDDHANRDRPATTINVTAAIADGRVHVSPRRFGAGPIRLIVSNQMPSTQAVTFETGGDASGVTATTEPIDPNGTATLSVDVTEGEYAILTDDAKVEPAAVRVGAPRPSAQDQLLLP